MADSSVGGLYLLRVFGLKVILVTAGLMVFVQIWIRWTLPRLRIDQVMTTCLKYLVPMSCFLFLGAVLWPLILLSSFSEPRATLLDFEPIGERVPKRVLVEKELSDEVETTLLGHSTDDKLVSVHKTSGGAQ